MKFDYTYWEPFSPQEAAQLFSGFPAPWCIAGGWGLDLFMGRISRPHDDIDLIIFRKDQASLFDIFGGFEIYVVDPPGSLRLWSSDEYLSAPLYNIWIRKERTGPWKLQVMLQDHNEQDWLFRRDHSISGPIEELILLDNTGIPILNPRIQLLYKAKNSRTKDWHDLQEILPHLKLEQRRWLHERIRQVYGLQHPWLEHLSIS